MGCSASKYGTMQKQHEADLAMVERLLARDGATLDAGAARRTTTLLIWKCRRNPRLIALAASWLEKHSDAKQAFDGVELYLPQLAHMLVHLDVDWPAGTLDRFALVVAQQSPHFALQLHWMLRAAMEDYAPGENGRGGHELYYRRCAHLANDVESCVAHCGAVPAELEGLFSRGTIGRDELSARARQAGLRVAKALVDAARTLRPVLRARSGTDVRLAEPATVPHRAASLEGPLRWRRPRRNPSRCCGARAWAWRAAVAKIEGRSLLVYAKALRGSGRPHGKLVRALPLDHAIVRVIEGGAAAPACHEFEVHARKGTSASFGPVRLRAPSADALRRWAAAIGVEARKPPAPPPGSPRKQKPDAEAPGVFAAPVDAEVPDAEAPDAEATNGSEASEDSGDSLGDDCGVGDERKDGGDERKDEGGQAARSVQVAAAPGALGRRAPRPSALTDPAALRRFEFFEDEKQFVDDLVNVAETLRALPRDRRQAHLGAALARVHVPPLSYLPLCNSTDAWRTVLRVVDDEGVVFNTKARCPCLVYFETSETQGFQGEDLANVVYAHVSRGVDARGTVASPATLPWAANTERAAEYRAAAGRAAARTAGPDGGSGLEGGERFDDVVDDRGLERDASLVEQMRVVAQRLSIWRDAPEAPPPAAGPRGARPLGLELRGLHKATGDDDAADDGTASPLHDGPAGLPASPPEASSGDGSERQSPASTAEAQLTERIHARAGRVVDHWASQFALASSSGMAHVERVFGRSKSGPVRDPENRSAAEGSRRPQNGGGNWAAKEQAIRSRSRLAAAPGWELRAVIVKSNDDLRQEVFVVQLVARYERHFRVKGLADLVYLRPYRIVALSASTGLIELVPDSTSLDGVFRKGTLLDHFDRNFGPVGAPARDAAVKNFIASMAAASFICYALAVKDRHNGNVLLDSRGRVVHIDFGFVLGGAPGGCASLERAPFKLTRGALDVMGGHGSRGHALFVDAFAAAMIAARDIVDETSTLIEIMQYQSRFPCFRGGRDAVASFRRRHHLQLDDAQLRAKARRLVATSLDSTGTALYDRFQYRTNKIAY
ncbi:kinase-like domain-containing protein [Pelagophyceae sp. CCMP2097]|nr:kinase-like domain-containing protein [Pelagophyceae sp. CCMP2097]